MFLDNPFVPQLSLKYSVFGKELKYASRTQFNSEH